MLFKTIKIENFRRGLATNSSSTHSIIYRNEGEFFKDLNTCLDVFGRMDRTIVASREAKIKYIAINIKNNKELFDIMCGFYPDMKQYEDDKYSEHLRGALYFNDVTALGASIDYIKNIIEDDSIVIIGGSDEEDFVYDITANHKKIPRVGFVDPKGLYKNGNYWVHIHASDYDGFRLRFSKEGTKNLIPKFPELVDLKITNKCDHGCKFCYQNSNLDGEHATFKQIQMIVNNLTDKFDYYPNTVEFAIGGGNILLHPQLEDIFKYITDRDHIVNTTITAKDCHTILKNENLLRIFQKYVSGIGISVSNTNDLGYLSGFKTVFHKQSLVLHLIPELIGVDKTEKIITRAAERHRIYDVLFLGYKQLGRAENTERPLLTEAELNKLFSDGYGGKVEYTNVDTAFANRYYQYLKDNFLIHRTLTTIEGEFSMYIDAVNRMAYKSSYQLDKPYKLLHENWEQREEDQVSSADAFALIRTANGLETIPNGYY